MSRRGIIEGVAGGPLEGGRIRRQLPRGVPHQLRFTGLSWTLVIPRAGQALNAAE